MKFFSEKFKTLKCKWNKTTLTEEDFWQLCKRKKISVAVMPLMVDGFYYCVKGQDYIAINSRLKNIQRLRVMFHEFGHYLMHAPEDGTSASFFGVAGLTRQEQEAEAFAWCCVFPLPLLLTKTETELIEEENFTRKMISTRRKVYERYGF